MKIGGSDEERDVLRRPETDSSKIRSANSEEEKTYTMNGLAVREDSAMSYDPEGDEIECEVEPTDWKATQRESERE